MISSILLLAAALSAGNAEFDRSAAEGAAKIAARRLVTKLSAAAPKEGILKQAMLARPGDYVVYTNAEATCRLLYAREVERAYEVECREIRRRLALPANYSLALTDRDRVRLSAPFAKTFAVERAQAVEEQAKTIVSTIRPSEAEFESLPANELRERITDQIVKGQKVKVFDENKKYITEKIVDPMIAGGHAERRRQRDYLMRARCDSAAPSRLKLELTKKLNENVAETRATQKDVTRAWGVFPSILTNDLQKAVDRRSADRLVAKMDQVKLGVNTNIIESLILRYSSLHAKTRESESQFANYYGKDIFAKSLAAATADVPPAEKQELATFLAKQTNDVGVVSAIHRAVRREVMPHWRIARDTLTKKQMASIWPELEDGVWTPPVKLADETTARNDYDKVVREWREISDLAKLASADKNKFVLEETNGRVNSRVKEAFDCARRAIQSQHAILNPQYDTLLAEYKKQAGQKAPTLSEIITRLTTDTKTKWDETRIATLWKKGQEPKNVDKQHIDLYPSVNLKIQVLAKAILQELSLRSAVKKPDTAESDEMAIEEIKFSISITRYGTNVSVSLMQGDQAVITRSCSDKKADLDRAIKEVTDILARDYLRLH